jgi:SNF2 family DNA or RNA helicase
MLDLVQKDLKDEGFDLARIDGQTSLNKRREAIMQFQENSNCTIMLASIGSAGEGYVVYLLSQSLDWGMFNHLIWNV